MHHIDRIFSRDVALGANDKGAAAQPTERAVHGRETEFDRHQDVGQPLTGVHLHNTRGQGLANALAAVEIGMTTIDSSMGGIGGCPAAPGASGNIVTEDLVFLLESMGLRTGVNFDKLMAAREVFRVSMPGVDTYGFSPDAGLPKGFVYA